MSAQHFAHNATTTTMLIFPSTLISFFPSSMHALAVYVHFNSVMISVIYSFLFFFCNPNTSSLILPLLAFHFPRSAWIVVLPCKPHYITILQGGH